MRQLPMAADRWADMVAKADVWASDELDAAMTLLSPDASMSDNKASSLSDEVKSARKIIAQTVERSRKVYGSIYASLPTELRAQVAHIAQGFANGLWVWLETKFQSTEEDHVSDLLESWSTLHQDVGESFDAFRASTSSVLCSRPRRRRRRHECIHTR